MNINTVTVVGANGVMGRNIAAIFASFGNAEVFLVSRSLEKSTEAKNKAYLSVRAESIKERMIPLDYEHLDQCVAQSDLIFEACAENWPVKEEIHKKLGAAAERNGDGKIFCSGTSGLSITRLAKLYPRRYRHQFMGMHFFNPPYQMTLCEMTPSKYADEERGVFEAVKEYARKVLHRTVVETKDTPGFLGNRIGFQFINEILRAAKEFKYSGGIDYVDSIMGPFTGRSMPPLVTANFVGLDVHKAIVENLYEHTEDYARETFVLPEYAERLIAEGKTGRKAGAGLYKTVVHDSGVKLHQVYDIAHGCYRERIRYSFPFANEMLRFLQVGDYGSAFRTLVENQSFEATMCCRFLLKYIVYSLNTVKLLGCDMGAADDVMAAGFRWCPPSAMLEAFAAVTDFEELCRERLDMRIELEGVGKSGYDYRKFILAKG